jgi:hypothetical protein
MQEFITNLDRRWIYLVLIVAIFIPLVKPIGMPISISSWTEAFYAEVDKLQAGDIAVLSVDYTPAGGPDVAPQAVAMFQHMMSKGVRVIGVSFLADGPPLLQKILDPYMQSGEKEYGVDFVNLGFIPGVETAMSAFAADMKRAAPADFFGTPTASLPLMKDVNSMHDVALLADFATGMPGPAEVVRQIGQNYPVTVLCGVVTAMGPQTEPYYQSGQIKGLLSGLRSAAEYEVRNGTPGSAAAGMDAQSLGHMVIIVAIALGNLAHFLSARKGKGGGKI